jgi:hypothetical protein
MPTVRGYSIERNGFTRLNLLIEQFYTDLTTLKDDPAVLAKYPPSDPFDPFDSVLAPSSNGGTIVLQAKDVDPLSATHPWRIRLEDDDGLKVNIATPLQIDDNGYVVRSSWQIDPLIKCGALGQDDPSDPEKQKILSYKHWEIDELLDNTVEGLTNWPLSYRLTVTDHGLAFFCWGEAITANWRPLISWFVVQRPVHPDTGDVLACGKAPLFCLYSFDGGGSPDLSDPEAFDPEGIRLFVVREIDVNVPTRSHTASKHSVYGNTVINPCKQLSFTEDKEFIVTFPNGLTSSRYAYIHEMDLVSYCSAGVIPVWTIADLDMYGEPDKRRYVALPANGPLDSFMRLLVLFDGNGIVNISPNPDTFVGTKC